MTQKPELEQLQEAIDWATTTAWEGEKPLWVTGPCPRHDRDKVHPDINPDTGGRQ